MQAEFEQRNIAQEWLAIAKENLLYARAGMGTDFSPCATVIL